MLVFRSIDSALMILREFCFLLGALEHELRNRNGVSDRKFVSRELCKMKSTIKETVTD